MGVNFVSHLSNKERMLLQDQLNHEEICIRKYSEYAEKTQDSQLRNMFYEFADQEMQHYNTIQGLLGNSGQNYSGNSQSNQQRNNSFQQSRSGRQNFSSNYANDYYSRSDDLEISDLDADGWMWEARNPWSGQETYRYQGQSNNSGRLNANTTSSSTLGNLGNDNSQWQDSGRGAFTINSLNRAGQASNQGQSTQQTQSIPQARQGVQNEQAMLNDMLMTEKYISGAYDTAIFESANQQVRQALRQIQEDEQKHGERLFNYMQQKGMYKTQ
jgi:rubrerythrin